MRGIIYLADNMTILPKIPDRSVLGVLTDPPYNSGKNQTLKTITVEADENGDRVGFQGKRYKTTVVGEKTYPDKYDDFMGFLRPRFEQVKRILTDNGCVYTFVDYREEHHLRCLLDEIFGDVNYLNSLRWNHPVGAYKRDRWPQKHDTIYLYAKQAGIHGFYPDQIERVPYQAPGMVTPEKAARGKIPSDVWTDTTIACGHERIGYPTQKPLRILRRMIQASTRKGEVLIDFFAGSGSTGAAALAEDRKFILVDHNPEAFAVMQQRFAGVAGLKFVDSNTQNLTVESDMEELNASD